MTAIFFFILFGFLPLFGEADQTFLQNGLALFEKEDFEGAFRAFQSAEENDPDPFHREASALYEAKCLLALNRPEEAEKKLNSIDESILKSSAPLYYELQFTLGKAALQRGDLAKAVVHLEEARPKRNADLASWNEKTEAWLAFCYDRLAKDPKRPLEERTKWREKGKSLLTGKEKITQPLDEALTAYENGRFVQALLLVDSFLNQKTPSYQRDEALYLKARCLENLGKESAPIYRELAENFPSSPFAAEAYFFSYPIEEYIEGKKTALKQLQKMPELYPDSPETLKALYLLGLDATRDRKSPEGKVITRKNLTVAVDRFQEVETRFEKLKAFDAFPKNTLDQWEEIRNRAKLKRADMLFQIGQQSQGAKQKIYLEYAEELYTTLLNTPFANEAQYALAATWLKEGEVEKAKEGFKKLVEKFRQNEENYYLALSFRELGLLALKEGSARNAELLFKKTLSSGKKLLSAEEELEIKIEISNALKKDNREEEALKELSEVVNFQAVSQLRLKAMYLRAMLYEEQNKRALAKRQLESLALKAGPWAQKAKEKLERDYGFN